MHKKYYNDIVGHIKSKVFFKLKLFIMNLRNLQSNHILLVGAVVVSGIAAYYLQPSNQPNAATTNAAPMVQPSEMKAVNQPETATATTQSVAKSASSSVLKEKRAPKLIAPEAVTEGELSSVVTQPTTLLAKRAETKEERKARKQRTIAERWKAEFEMLKDPKTGKIPRADVIRSKEVAKFVPELQLSPILNPDGTEALPTITVESRGPNNYGGRTRALGFDVRNTQIVLSGGVTSGIYRSTNGGASWTRVTPGGEMHYVTAIAQDTRTGQQDVWYCGTGEYSSGSDGSSADGEGGKYFGHGIWKSTDNGLTWTALANTRGNQYELDNAFDYISRIIVDPTNGNVFAAASGTIQRSTNGGVDWTPVLGTFNANNVGMGDIIFNTSNNRLYAALYGDGIYASNTGAVSEWAQIATSTALEAGGIKRIVLSNVANTNKVLALCETTNNVACTSGGGNTKVVLKQWTPSGAGAGDGAWTDHTQKVSDCAGGSTTPKIINTQNGYNMCITTKPDDENLVYLGGVEIYRLNLNTSAYEFIGGSQASANTINLHVDNHLLAFEPGNNVNMWAANDGGLRKTDVTGTIKTTAGADNGYDWTDRTSGYTSHQYYGVDINPTNGSAFVMGGAQDNAYTIHPTNAQAKEVGPTVDGVMVGVISGTDFTNYSAIISWQNGAIARLTNGTDTDIKPTGQAQEFLTIFLLDADNTNHLYFPTNTKKLYRTRNAANIADGTISADAATNWQEITGVAATISDNITTMEVSRNNAHSNTAYNASDANRKMYLGTKDGKVYRLADPAFCAVAATPVNITPAGATGYVSDIAVNPYDDKEILVTYSNYGVQSVWHTNDASVATPTWNGVEGAAGTAVQLASARAAMIVKAGNDKLYIVGTSTGLYGTTALSGATTVWEKISSGDIGQAVCIGMRLRPSDNKMALGTHGNGLYMLTFPAAVLPIELLAFNAQKQDKQVKLTWKAANPDNFSHFVVEKSTDGKKFTELKMVEVLNTHDYSTLDENPSVGVNYYRLAMVDKDKTVNYSKVVSVVFETSAQANIFPNPAKGNDITLDIDIEKDMNIDIQWIDAAGRVSLQQQQQVQAGKNKLSLNVNDLPAGMYWIQIRTSNKQLLNMSRFVKM